MSIYVNLFVGSAVTIEHVAGTILELVQATDYPWKGAVSMTVNPEASRSFAMKIRVPNRDVSRLYTSKPAANGITSLKVNGTKVTPVIANGYATITRTWKKGDRIELELPLIPQRVYASDKIVTVPPRNPADPTAAPAPIYPAKGKVALRYGPLVYNIEQADQDAGRATHFGSSRQECRPVRLDDGLSC